MSKSAKEFYNQNYHSPLTHVPVLLGIEDGEECWEDVPIENVLEAHHQSRVNAISDEEISKILVDVWHELISVRNGVKKIKELLKQ